MFMQGQCKVLLFVDTQKGLGSIAWKLQQALAECCVGVLAALL